MPRCKSCKAPIVFGETPNGRAIPLDAEPNGKGSMVCINGKARHATAEDRALLRPLYMPHHATCPNVDDCRRPRP